MNPDLEPFRLLAEQLKDSTPGETEVVAKGRRWRVRRHPAPGIRLILEPLDSEGARAIAFEPSELPHADYPPDLPFMQGASAMITGVNSTPPSRMVMWSEIPDVAEFAQRVQEASTAEGWEVTRPLATVPGFPMGLGELRRGASRRLLTMTTLDKGRMVSLMQTEKDEAL